MKYLMIIFALFLFSCGNNLKVNEEVEDLQDQEFVLDSLIRGDSLADFSSFQNDIKYIFVHCFASSDSRDWTIAEIDNLWESYGWSRGGYHFIIFRSGQIYIDQPINDGKLEYFEIRNGVKYHNHESIHISWMGGWKGTDTRTPLQKVAMRNLLIMLKSIIPNAEIVSHNTFNQHKSCPNFSAEKEYEDL